MANAQVKNLNFGLGELKINGTAVTADASELNCLDGVSSGQVVASKALVADSAGQIQGISKPVEYITGNRTVLATESGLTLIVNAADLVISLPATVEGFELTVWVLATSSSTGASISPVAADKIQGKGLTAADNKDLINTHATEAVGDWVRLVGDGVDGWIVAGIAGTWARQA